MNIDTHDRIRLWDLLRKRPDFTTTWEQFKGRMHIPSWLTEQIEKSCSQHKDQLVSLDNLQWSQPSNTRALLINDKENDLRFLNSILKDIKEMVHATWLL